MMSAEIKKEWVSLMGPIAAGHGTREMVRAFDLLTSDVYRHKIIDFNEFLGAQLVISTAKKGAEAAARAGIEGVFLA